jgi:DNA mismatch endonuclease (patch repair protein)
VDTLTPAERSKIMSLVRSKDTGPEILVRGLVSHLGYRYRLHRHDLPGSPDLVFPARQKVIFVHGCFWHRHACPSGRRMPKSRVDFWTEKLIGNRRRDERIKRQLQRLGWRVLTVWECQLKNPAKVMRRIEQFIRD